MSLKVSKKTLSRFYFLIGNPEILIGGESVEGRISKTMKKTFLVLGLSVVGRMTKHQMTVSRLTKCRITRCQIDSTILKSKDR